ncbi:MAG: hypothetical protein ACRD8O_01570 [Bryobacteraceae bacterium]
MWKAPAGSFGIIALLLVSIGCARREANIESVLAPDVDRWKRSSLSPKAPAGFPGEVRRFGVRSAHTAAYQGPGRIEADLYELNSDAAGLDLVQKWRPAANTVVFHRDRWFAVVRWDSAERDAVTAFVRALEKQLGSR